MHELLEIDHSGDTVRWTLNRKEALNAVNYEVMSALELALESIEEDAGIRVLLFTAAGDTFISGGDLRAFAELKTAEEGRSMADRMKSILSRIENLPCITVCLINGDAYGGGCETALAFDQIWLRDTAKMGFTQANFALSPGWGGYTRLIERVGATTALKWLSERRRVDADEGSARGLIDHVIPSTDYNDAVEDHIRAITHTDPTVLRALKAVKRSFISSTRDSLMAFEATLFEGLWAADEHHARVERFNNRNADRG